METHQHTHRHTHRLGQIARLMQLHVHGTHLQGSPQSPYTDTLIIQATCHSENKQWLLKNMLSLSPGE